MATSVQRSGELGQRVFATTHWSVVLAAGEGESEQARHELEILCAAYRYPIYVYVRRTGYGPDDAEKLPREFFAQLIAKKHLRRAAGLNCEFKSRPTTVSGDFRGPGCRLASM